MAALLASIPPTEADPRPNVILIMADDLGYGELGCYGQKKIRTPNVDRLAAEGARFTDYYTGSAVCAPARCNLMTGLHGGHAPIRDNAEVGEWDSFRGQFPLPEGIPTIASVLHDAGYATGAFGKWGLGEPGSSGDPLRRGFDRFFGYNCQRHAHNYYPRYLIDDDERRPLDGNDRGITGAQYAPRLIADELLLFIRRHRDRPFFVYYPSVLPHLALQVPDEEIAAYRDAWPETPYTGNSYLPHPTPRAAYAAMISFLDRQVGRITETLDELGIAGNTLILFTSDNGPTHLGAQVDYGFFNSAGGLRGLKGSLYEGGIRVPLVARWPGRIAPGLVLDRPAAHYDLLATLADVTGSPVPAQTDGISFRPLLEGRRADQRDHDYLFWNFAGYGGQIAIRQGPWKGILTNLRRNPDAPLQLFHLERDPAESEDVSAAHPDVVRRLRERILEARDEPAIDRFRFGP